MQSRYIPKATIAIGSLLGLSLAVLSSLAQNTPSNTGGGGAIDPGVQSASRGTGGTIINPNDDPNGFTAFFNDGQIRFQEVETVTNSANVGLGPRFNSNQCSSCHAQPAVGGTGAAKNPQFLLVNSGVAPDNTTPSFITANGPTREARFPFFFNSNGQVNTSAPNGGVEDLFTVTGSAGTAAFRQGYRGQ
jgi:hypothetical protein